LYIGAENDEYNNLQTNRNLANEILEDRSRFLFGGTAAGSCQRFRSNRNVARRRPTAKGDDHRAGASACASSDR